MKKYLLLAIILLAIILRFWQLGKNPPSLYWDEVSLGYNAYSILTTAHDEHGKFLPLINFAAFGDYKPPGYIYAAVAPIALFDLSEFAVRFPSAFFGVLTVVLTYFLAKKLFENENVALLASLFLAISPWHLQFSRAAFEGNMALFFSTLGIYLFLKFATDKPYYMFLSAASFLIALYTFTGQRLFVPFILLILLIQFRKKVLANIKLVVVTAVASSIIFWPLFKFATFTIEGRLRFNEVTIFKDLAPIDDSIRFRQTDNFSPLSNIIHNRRFFFAHQYLIHYFDSFSPSFLFSNGDVNPRLSIQTVGELYYYDLILVVAGIYFLFYTKSKYRFLIIGWLLVSPLGPATARETPHALRMIHILPTYQLIAAFGLYNLYGLFKFKKLFVTFSFLILTFSFLYYLHMYYVHYPRQYASQWQYGYRQAVKITKNHYNLVDNIIVTSQLGRPYVYFLFYMKYDPIKYWNNAKIIKDQFFFFDVASFDKFHFSNAPLDEKIEGKKLYIVAPGQLPKNAQDIEEVRDPNGQTVLEIGTVN